MKLDSYFYAQNAVDAAKNLIGKVLIHNTHEGMVSGIITEAEAYMGPEDRAAHAYNHRGREGRTAVMYRPGGVAYMYLIYGMYHCFNVVVGAEDVPQCVLIRAVKPVAGLELMLRRRPVNDLKRLCDGPGKLCRAFGLDMRHYGMDLTGEILYIEDTEGNFRVEASKRIGMGDVGEARDYLYRFTMTQ
ncbi:MAG: DNA-3-methyladenine glycosylase [Defluviitaleaceae bacterium]|nr:DNA-3-methyladenine glycosylase [Defluviitaleaceae bacterium]MCL2837291.1 DNA-3-methyladenine glycosylase [Defluviitaleaceae bacterium]